MNVCAVQPILKGQHFWVLTIGLRSDRSSAVEKERETIGINIYAFRILSTEYMRFGFDVLEIHYVMGGEGIAIVCIVCLPIRPTFI